MTPEGHPVRVKICGLRRREDVVVADGAGADYVGVILSAGFARSVDVSLAPSLVEGIRAVAVAVLVDEAAEGAAARAAALGAGVLQLHGSEPPEVVRALAETGRWRIWKSVRVREADDVDRAVERYGRWVRGLLLEGWKEGVVGGGGAALDAARFAAARERLPDGVELVLAGGLRPDNVAEALARFRPDVVDVSSGVEREPGRKSHDLVRLFVKRARAAAAGAPDRARPTDEQGNQGRGTTT